MKGSDFIEQIVNLPRIPDREQAVLDAVAAGNAIAWPMLDVPLSWNGHAAVLSVAADYLAIGDDDDFVRVPLSPLAAQRVADQLGATLPTPRLVDIIWHAAAVRIAPQPWGPPYDASMLSVDRFAKHNARIEDQRKGRTGLIVGHKKDVVLSERLASRPSQVAIYGWHQLNGVAIQPLSLIHENTYADYSHGIRFIGKQLTLDGTDVAVEAVLRSHELAGLLTNEGPMTLVRVPGVPADGFTPTAMLHATAAAALAASAARDAAPLGVRALASAQRELDRGVKEVPPGSNSGPDIRAYFSGCQRNGLPLRLTAGNWCAAFASWCAFQAAGPGETLPHGWRAAVAELWADALAQGAARAANSGYVPRVGDLAIYKRDTGDPTRGGIGHVGRVAQVPDANGNYRTIEGNHGDAVALVPHQMGDAVGWIAYPRDDVPVVEADDGALVTAAGILSTPPPATG
jgi:CHAP domain